MYQVYCDGLPLLDLQQDEEFVLIDPAITLKDNDSGQFSFKISTKHPFYNNIRKLKSEILVLLDGAEIFCGRVTEEGSDFYKNKKFIAKGELDFLTDSIQRPAEYHNMTVRGFLATLIEVHNAQVEENKHFQVGEVTVVDDNDSLYRYTNYENTLECIKEKLLKKLGGHIRIRKVEGVKYIDYLADYPNTNEQVIEFGKNLLDFSTNTDATDIATAIIPLGGKLATSTIQALDERLTIKNVNDGSDFIYSQEAVDTYGWIFRKVIFDDVNTSRNLLRKGRDYLTNVQYENMILKVSAVDLHRIDVEIERIKLLDRIRVKSSPHALDRYFPVTELKLNLMKPESDKITLGSEGQDTTFTSSSIGTNQEVMERINAVPSERVILQEAIDNATALITAATHGHVVTTAEEQLIMDTDDVETAQKVWRWNVNGLGYSSTGYNGTYATAITMDGTIVGQRIVAGSVSADKLDINYRSSVEQQISTAQDNAEGYTDTKLGSYWTALETQTAIQNSADSVLISANATAEAYTDTRLQNYSTTAQIQVTTDAITAEVSRKFNTSDWSTTLRLSASDIQFAWNNISKYIQFENAELCIYDSVDEQNHLLRTKFNDEGNHFYRDGYYVGKVGTNSAAIYILLSSKPDDWEINFSNYYRKIRDNYVKISGDSAPTFVENHFYEKDTTHKGLVFDLDSQGKYMAFAQKSRSGENTNYTTMLCFSRANSIYDEYGLHLGCDLYGHYNTIHDVYLDGVRTFIGNSSVPSHTGDIEFVSDCSLSNGQLTVTKKTLKISNGIVYGIINS